MHVHNFNVIKYLKWVSKIEVKYVQLKKTTISEHTIQWHLIHSQYCAATTSVLVQNVFINSKEKPPINQAVISYSPPLRLWKTLSYFLS